VRVAKVTNNPVKTQAPAAIDTVFDELRRHGAGRFGVEDLFQGRILVHATVDQRVQTIVTKRSRPASPLREAAPSGEGADPGLGGCATQRGRGDPGRGGRAELYENRYARYSDFNRATGALRQAGSAWKPLVYLAAFRQGLKLDTTVPDEPSRYAWGLTVR